MRLRILLGTIILVAALAIYGIAAMAVAVAPAAEAHHLLAAFDRAVADDEAERFALVVQLLKRRRPEQRFILRLRRDPRDQPIEAGDLAMQVMGRGHVLCSSKRITGLTLLAVKLLPARSGQKDGAAPLWADPAIGAKPRCPVGALPCRRPFA